MEHPGIKNVTWEIKNSLDGFKRRQDLAEERINELEEKSMEYIQSETKIWGKNQIRALKTSGHSQ